MGFGVLGWQEVSAQSQDVLMVLVPDPAPGTCWDPPGVIDAFLSFSVVQKMVCPWASGILLAHPRLLGAL